MPNEKCYGCFNASYDKNPYGWCEGCMGQLDFQLKCYHILAKLFSIDQNGQLLQEECDLTKENQDFLKKLLKYNQEKKDNYYQELGKQINEKRKE